MISCIVQRQQISFLVEINYLYCTFICFHFSFPHPPPSHFSLFLTILKSSKIKRADFHIGNAKLPYITIH
ncbi:hypothetical protein EGR_10637 [Echinococcus granulosus]|uniref:Uncharacterized protein n=1 Tax=Echinococcus granulosus TaxID=6210 RepID=W6U1V1_ECHGR|nr:hypothetical protein EGR_10637 [Echinococcus granulosus]EUB54501.1 hypothetical protein EGR_10637 [Echinococcus granulosus]